MPDEPKQPGPDQTPAVPAAGARENVAPPADKAAAPAAKPAPQAAKPAAPGAKPAAAAKPPAAAKESKAAAPTGPPDPPPPADVALPAFITELQEALPGAVEQVSYWVGDWTVIVPAGRLLEVMHTLHDAPEMAFDYCSDVTATDWPPRAKRFDVIYCLYSIAHRQRLRVKVRAGDGEPVPSVTGIWPAANWLEREVYDMFGISFTGHPDLRRILMPEEWQGHPERKDYPLEGPGELLLESPLEWLKLRQAREESDYQS